MSDDASLWAEQHPISNTARPAGDPVVAPEPVPVVARLAFADGSSEEVPGRARSWTAGQVCVHLDQIHSGRRILWLDSADVRRP